MNKVKFDAKIEINIFKENKNIVITIFNNCGNIDEQIIERIFEPYFTTKFENQGTGIGLYMTKVIVEKNMNGKIEAKNLNDGVEFIIKLNA
ncbi:MAG: HAMP domain-containing sensor histidine kinase [Aliarcobacter sp.]|nr:HAMP domain-containing sensor histidine kinase [Aliarcobacter sp.]